MKNEFLNFEFLKKYAHHFVVGQGELQRIPCFAGIMDIDSSMLFAIPAMAWWVVPMFSAGLDLLGRAGVRCMPPTLQPFELPLPRSGSGSRAGFESVSIQTGRFELVVMFVTTSMHACH